MTATKTRIKTLSLRIQALENELNDPTCQRFQAAAREVQARLAEVKRELAETKEAMGLAA